MAFFQSRAVLAALASIVLLGVVVGTSRVAPATQADDVRKAACKICTDRNSSCIVVNNVAQGCCFGNVVIGNDGHPACCGGPASLYDQTTGSCVAQCPDGTTKCQNTTCVAPCDAGNFLEPISCSCILHCAPGQAQCGNGCCPEDQECSVPAGLPESSGLAMKCCPMTLTNHGVFVGGACEAYCKSELKSHRLMCCKGGGLYSADGSLDKGGQVADAKTQICCGGIACNKRVNWCINNRCVPKWLFH